MVILHIVDEYDKVRFFSRAKDRFFPRSPAIIGRDVQNCHPPESMHVVEKIISEFKNVLVFFNNKQKINHTISITDLSGKIVLKKITSNSNIRLDISALSKGIYFVTTDVQRTSGIRLIKY